MKKILFIATGGTIASAKTENGLTPAITSEELLNAVPQVKNLCAVDTVQPYSLDSTNMCWKQWIHVAEIIRDSYAKYDGFVIAHGTDTLSYAAATLSYLIQKNEKPVVLTGAQKSIEVPDGDARRNLFEAFVYATDARACGTHVVFNGHVTLQAPAPEKRIQRASTPFPALISRTSACSTIKSSCAILMSARSAPARCSTIN